MGLERSMAIVIAGLAAAVAAHCDTARGDTVPKAPVSTHAAIEPDIKFLEYLGTLEGDDENWTEVASAESVSGDDTESTSGAAAEKTAVHSRTESER